MTLDQLVRLLAFPLMLVTIVALTCAFCRVFRTP